jgi:hypothetical protein
MVNREVLFFCSVTLPSLMRLVVAVCDSWTPVNVLA